MRHWQAARALPELLDQTLPALVEAEVRAHAERCRRCRRTLAEHEASERLLAQLPVSLMRLDGRLEHRLDSLARWAGIPTPTWGERLGLSALGAFAAAAMLAMVLSTAGWLPQTDDVHRDVTLAAVLPDTDLLPMGRWR